MPRKVKIRKIWLHSQLLRISSVARIHPLDPAFPPSRSHNSMPTNSRAFSKHRKSSKSMDHYRQYFDSLSQSQASYAGDEKGKQYNSGVASGRTLNRQICCLTSMATCSEPVQTYPRRAQVEVVCSALLNINGVLSVITS